MRSISCLLELFFVATFCAVDYLLVAGLPRSYKNCGTRNVGRIVGGWNVRDGKYPWMVSLVYKVPGYTGECGGFVVNSEWILTAAHCVQDKDPKGFEIHAGIHRRSEKKSQRYKKYEVARIVIHEGYNNKTWENDIALLRTRSRVDIKGSGGYINAICLPTTDADPTGKATAMGWGHHRFNGVTADILREVEVEIIPRETCKKKFEKFEGKNGYAGIKSTMICSGGEERNTCQGDSGGPLVQIDKKGVATVVGIFSYGMKCGVGDHPGVSTKVGSFLDWLEKYLGSK